MSDSTQRQNMQCSIIEKLIEAGILATRETNRRRGGGIALFGNQYYTNLDLDFQELERPDNDALIDQITNYIKQYCLKDSSEHYKILHLREFQAEPYTRGIFNKITTGLNLSVASKPQIKQDTKLVILAPLYSRSLEDFIVNYEGHINAVILLLAPGFDYLRDAFQLEEEQVHTLISIDTLEHISRNIRQGMITGNYRRQR